VTPTLSRSGDDFVAVFYFPSYPSSPSPIESITVSAVAKHDRTGGNGVSTEQAAALETRVVYRD
jgi:hypothetical protein